VLTEYYQSELAYYRELAGEFARAYPEVAHLVSQRGGDAAVERLVQGAALLTGRLRHRIDDDFPEVIHTLFDMLWPQHLRPIPALTLLQLAPQGEALRQSQLLPRGMEVKSRPVDGVECVFRTTTPLGVHPLRVEDVKLTRPHPADLQLKVRFRFTGGATFDNVKLQSLRLQLVGDRATSFTLLMWLARFASGVSICDEKGEACARLPRGALRPVGTLEEEALVQCSPTPLPGLRLLQELFCFPEQFLGVEVTGLDGAPPGRLHETFWLVFHLGSAPRESVTVDGRHFALGCTPAINLSGATTLEVPVEDRCSVYRLNAPRGGDIFSVDRVGAFDTESDRWVEYEPFLAQRSGGGPPTYNVIRRSDAPGGVQTYLSIVDQEGRPLQPPATKLTLSVTYTDGERPLRLGAGEVNVAGASAPQFVSSRNITPVVPGVPLILGRERHWQLVAQFAMHPRDLMSLNGIRQLLATCRAPAAERPPQLVRDVRTRVSSRLHRQMVLPLTQVELELEEGAFLCEGERYLFGRLLAALLIDRPQSRTFTEVTVIAGEERYSFGGTG
jgi:type VI secretion system protein ImpG